MMPWPSRALWWGAWIASLIPASVAVVLLLPEWLARLAAILIRPAKYTYRRAKGWTRGIAGTWVKGAAKPNRRRT